MAYYICIAKEFFIYHLRKTHFVAYNLLNNLPQTDLFMKVKHILSFALAALLGISGINAQSLSPSTKTHWDKGTLVVETPERPVGQEHALGLTAPKLEVVHIGIIGLGMRGDGAVTRLINIPGVEITALCDIVPERVEEGQAILR
jgi:hypothetical protein